MNSLSSLMLRDRTNLSIHPPAQHDSLSSLTLRAQTNLSIRPLAQHDLFRDSCFGTFVCNVRCVSRHRARFLFRGTFLDTVRRNSGCSGSLLAELLAHPNRLAIAYPRPVPLSGFGSRRGSHARRACDRARTRSPFEDHVWERSHASDAAPAISTRSLSSSCSDRDPHVSSPLSRGDTYERHLDTLLFRE